MSSCEKQRTDEKGKLDFRFALDTLAHVARSRKSPIILASICDLQGGFLVCLQSKLLGKHHVAGAEILPP